MKTFSLKIALHALLIGLGAASALWLHVHGFTYAACFMLILSVYFFYALLRLFSDILRDFQNFVEAIQYRDFSQQFSIQRAPSHLRFFRRGFNEIVSGYKKLSKEKELQFQYLQNVLELVDTSIMAFEISTGHIVWINNQMKELLQIPGIKNTTRMQRLFPVLYEAFYSIPVSEQKVLAIRIKEVPVKLLLTSNTFKTDDKDFKLVALQNVDEALDVTETEAWNKLLRVLTHEIMNSIAPISSLANTLQDRLGSIDQSIQIPVNDFKDLQDGIETIKSRSNGLMRFSESYRNLNKIGQANLSEFYVRDVFENLVTLMLPNLTRKQISLEIILKNPNLKIEADRQLLEQLFINLLLNAIDAVKDSEEKQVVLSGEKNDRHQIILKVADSGSGMSQQIMERIFIPFFSTKKAGSGIGLSLCKQIMLLHKGSIQVKSAKGQGTAFTMQFPEPA